MTANLLRRALWLSAGLLVWSSASGCTSEVDSEEPGLGEEASSITLFSNPTARDAKSINLELAPPARRVEITAADFRFTPSQLFAKPGERLIVVLRNAGTNPHSIVFEFPEGRQGLERPLNPGERAQLSITMPWNPGNFVYYCPVGDHRERGMRGVVTVARPR